MLIITNGVSTMDAIEFVKKFGLDFAKKLSGKVISVPDEDLGNCIGPCGQSEFDKLKQIVDAFELVEKWHGLSCAKGVCNNGLSDDKYISGYTNGICDVTTKIYDLKQVIKLMEQCSV